jgi:predicted TIM-barrel fold metal-dependent hydrolase
MVDEPILDPELPIIDPHHHLWDMRGRFGPDAPPARHGFEALLRRSPHYLLDQLLADIGAGHNVRATVFVECGAMYRAGASAALAPVGETEFVNGVAAMSASGLYGEARACAGIVGHADLTLGDAVAPVLEAHLAAGGGRFRGVRQSARYDPDPAVLGPLGGMTAGFYRSAAFRAGFAHLAAHRLSFDAWLLEPQLPDLIDLASTYPETTIILDHLGTPLGIGAYAGQREGRFDEWRNNIRALAERPNVVCKIGGLAMPFLGFPSFMADPPASSEMLAQEWRPYVETAIEAFGAERCMFESNFPVDAGTCDYATLWNAFKRLAAGASADEKAALFHDTARRTYRLEARSEDQTAAG